MKHVRMISKQPARAVDIPAATIIAFITSVLTALGALLTGKEAVTAANA